MKRLLLYVYAPLTALYLLMSVIYPMDHETMVRRHLTLGQARVASLAIAIASVVIWLLSFYGARRLQEYSQGIKKAPDGEAFTRLAQGVWLLALYLPMRALVKILLNYLVRNHPGLQGAVNDVIIYVTLLLPLVGFVVISQAAWSLARLAKVKMSLSEIYTLSLVYITLGVTYSYVSFTAQGHIPPSNWLVTSLDSIPLAFRIVTVIVPYLFMWFIGLLAVYDLYLYQQQVKGIFYRQSLRWLSSGLMAVIVVSIAIQFATAMAPSLQKLSFRGVLLLVFGLIIILGAAFAVIAKGVRRLKKLDEV